jgi:hypothetical protein
MLFSRLLLFIASAGVAFAANSTPAPEANRNPSEAARPAWAEKTPPGDALAAQTDAKTLPLVRLLANSHRLSRQGDWLQRLARFSAEDFASALEAFGALEKLGLAAQLTWEWDILWEKAAETVPKLAMEKAEQLAKEKRHATLPRLVLRSWAQQDTAAARAWLEADPARPEEGVFQQALLEGWSRRDLKTATAYAVEYVTKHPDDGPLPPYEAVKTLRDAALRQGLIPGLLAWFQELPAAENEQSFKALAVAAVAGSVGARDVKEAARFLTSVKEPELFNGSLIMSVASRYAREIGDEAAMQWVATLQPKPNTKKYFGAGVVAEHWAQKDSEGLAKWFLAHKDDAVVDSAIFGFVRYLARNQPQAARKWAAEIKDEILRTEALELSR